MKPAELPPPVRPGARVGVAALSGAVDPGRLEAGLAALSGLGFTPVKAANLERRSGPGDLFAGSDAERLDAFHTLAADSDLEAIFFARGGYGATRILADVDWSLLADRPRAYVGYSDLTPFLLQAAERLGVAAFHGPMVAADLARGLSGAEERSLLAALAGELPQTYPLAATERPGRAAGPLAGGCLSLLAATAGTPLLPSLDGCVLFLEDVAEPLYRLDRMLTQLRLAGVLDGIAGTVLGHFDHPPGELAAAWPELCCEALGQPGLPLAVGLASGHAAPNLTLPLGATARLEAPAGGPPVLTVGLPAP